ncbi:MAG TPA: ATP-binding protein [Polyangiaceae bacterium]|nr:ATP-binding protein [Polyangiaceae bacterium]
MKIGARGKLLFASFGLIFLAALSMHAVLDGVTGFAFWGLTALIALVAAAFLSGVLMRIAGGAVANLAAEAQRMASGQGEPHLHNPHEEFSELARTLERLSKNWSRTVDELRGEGDRMRTILEGMQEGVLLLDDEGRIELVNSALREMLLLASDAVGRTPLEVVRNAELKELFDGVRESGEPSLLEIEVGGLKPRRLLVRAGTVGGEQREILAVFVDVTEVRRLESMRRDFVANVSHELRTPVTAIRSAAETLQVGIPTDPEMLRKFIGIIERNAERLHMLVEDLLDLSRIESREYRLSSEPVELRALVAQISALFRDRVEKKRMELVNDVGDAAALADRKALEHVITNLIDNAVKYCVTGCKIRIWSEPTSEGVRLLVEDDGPGIEEKHLPRIFERFYRVDAGRSRELGGTGLGLSIVKNLVEAMSGRVSVESAPGAGTRFSILLKRDDTPGQSGSGKDSRAVA